MSVLNEISIERQSQIEKGFTPKHDDQHISGELAESAAYLAVPGKFVASDTVLQCATHAMSKHCRRKCLIIAAAMLVAEIERMDREQATIDLSLTPEHPEEPADYQPGDELPG